MSLIALLENSAYAEFVRSSPSFFAYTWILSLHAMGLALIVGVNTLVALRLLGFVPELPLSAVRKMFPWMYAGFVVNALSGGSLLIANFSELTAKAMFLTKLVFVLLAMINIELTRTQVFDRPAVMALPAPQLAAHAWPFAIASIVLWALATITGRLTAYPGLLGSLLGIE